MQLIYRCPKGTFVTNIRERNMASVLLLLGSNMGERLSFLQQAREQLALKIGPIKKLSSCYETAAWGKTDQADFVNQVLKIETKMEPQLLLQSILQIERELGRERLEKWGSRTIDIDILFYNEEEINFPDLKIPHKNLHERAFTLVPLCEIEPDWFHPVLQKTASELLSELNDTLSVRKLN